jgi:hypothetical protein
MAAAMWNHFMWTVWSCMSLTNTRQSDPGSVLIASVKAPTAKLWRSNAGFDTGYPEGFRGIPQFLQANTRTVCQIIPWPKLPDVRLFCVHCYHRTLVRPVTMSPNDAQKNKLRGL